MFSLNYHQIVKYTLARLYNLTEKVHLMRIVYMLPYNRITTQNVAMNAVSGIAKNTNLKKYKKKQNNNMKEEHMNNINVTNT